jgi:CubicO group peptidase (beta-lactamase class C family)
VEVYGEHQKGKAAPKNTIFNVASITKPVVALTTLKLVSNGDWDLDEPLYHYWVDPEVKNDTLYKLITTRHCLSHSTGFRNWRRQNENGRLAFDFSPGEKFQYSGEGMEYLRRSLEAKFKVTLDKLVDSLIFEPQKMRDATLAWIPEKDTIRFAKWYNNKGQLHNMDFRTETVNAADDMLITVDDMAKFGLALMKKEIIKNNMYEIMITPQSKINRKLNQGLGWVLLDSLPNNEYLINHDGGDLGVSTTLLLFPKSQNGIIIFTNSDNGRAVCNEIIREITPIGKDILEGLNWENKIPDIFQLSTHALDEFSGTYVSEHIGKISFRRNNNNLITSGDQFPIFKLFPRSENEFFTMDQELFFRFLNERSNKIFQLIEKGEIVLEANKVN